jgi:hypothetical protein
VIVGTNEMVSENVCSVIGWILSGFGGAKRTQQPRHVEPVSKGVSSDTNQTHLVLPQRARTVKSYPVTHVFSQYHGMLHTSYVCASVSCMVLLTVDVGWMAVRDEPADIEFLLALANTRRLM